MTREEQIKQYCEDMGFPLGSCSSINSIKAITACDAIKWADKTMIEKFEQFLRQNNKGQLIGRFNRFLEE